MNKKHIYICSPSAPYDPKDFPATIKSNIRNLKKLGFEVTVSKHALDYHGNTSANITDRVSDLHEGFKNSKYDVVMALCGGWNSNEILPFLDYKLVKDNPKLFVGFSDMTTLGVNLWQKANIQTIYGHTLTKFDLNETENYAQFVNVINDINGFNGFTRKKINKKQVYRPGVMEGRLVGGCLAVLCWLLGTPYQLRVPEKEILFLEDDEETNGYYWQMYLAHLKQAEYFENISGLVLGKVSKKTKFNRGAKFKDILKIIFKDYKFPILINADIGHIENPICIPYGLKYRLSL
ncbi:MAG: Peptidase U61 LD-carboxypeptidase A [Candidatus Beckwithbacteria bacterium GW2011_GWB1_47_15]|uniref:Peptidase U61 LD-carboxypeptidase A n=1 Tax=Candidatus Beckwithbacteria bacterium GW2011_GWB1_47_15 TaxID=1618371 RepID=A0A0G1RTE6_9BACT|nr:MAG: peptidase U61 LD-carboxypeptidase A, muramoyltetrapeptide carboxypeptidase [Candidatus Beckwithbacteria bacterium GW2011_GWC1_49_16]KKU34686.1 MAG: Peptidase U61 LD-carboxypeptidase A [Candidatus Beckwithbacteria bacterium GW2011_GWA1_46_30]KKU60432.1 MAG: Peptidase U61 LD-carboxypeptidase A [Candidatus Beckwithbacteria bacterium GW2011_GWB1_47_15]KKU71615.1 MAG: Peptidase U61 LD-carboxypeptidase A [Candidatus Beckwithbacteria bacterium GW2011_GWA2_47_25]OGD48193.1 MAG: hypothetical pro